MTTGSVIVGSGVRGWIVCGPAPGMLKLMVCTPGVALALMIAWRREPGPLSLMLAAWKGSNTGSVTARTWFAATPLNDSVAPDGHATVTSSTLSAAPRPNRADGSDWLK